MAQEATVYRKEYHLQQVLSVVAATDYLWFSIPIGRLHFAYWSALLSYWSNTNSLELVWLAVNKHTQCANYWPWDKTQDKG